MRRARGRHDGRPRRQNSQHGGISDHRKPGRARGAVGVDHPSPRRWGGMTHRIRAAKPNDLRALYDLAKLTGGGFTNLPADKSTLETKLAKSEEGFNRE